MSKDASIDSGIASPKLVLNRRLHTVIDIGTEKGDSKEVENFLSFANKIWLWTTSSEIKKVCKTMTEIISYQQVKRNFLDFKFTNMSPTGRWGISIMVLRGSFYHSHSV